MHALRGLELCLCVCVCMCMNIYIYIYIYIYADIHAFVELSSLSSISTAVVPHTAMQDTLGTHEHAQTYVCIYHLCVQASIDVIMHRRVDRALTL
jgi:hypothetical protein